MVKLTESVDIMPTILDVLNIDIPAQCDGRSILPFCRNQEPNDWREEYHTEFDLRSPYDGKFARPLGLEVKHCMVNIIYGERYKCVHFTTLPAALFGLKNDPNEFTNLADDPAYQDIKYKMVHDEPGLTGTSAQKEKS
ncbi:MAG: arylsulfatase A-like enzyme [Parasphingorhabdus sp.]|jgi:arylsulfatase A-like enzyme